MAAACKLFAFRHSMEKLTREQVEKVLNKWCSYWVYQIERGDSGYMHYQGAFSLIKKRRKHELIKHMGEVEGFAFEYCEPMPKSEAEHIRNVDGLLETYAGKFDTRVEGPFSNKKAVVEFRPRQCLKTEQLYPWQQQVVESLKSYEERTINVLHDRAGNRGKSSLITYCMFEKLAFKVNSEKATDIVADCCNYCMDNELRTCAFLFDMPRGLQPSRDHLVGIESLKSGMLFDRRHHAAVWWINAPTIWIICNELPNMKYLSADRWKLWHIDENLHLTEGADVGEQA